MVIFRIHFSFLNLQKSFFSAFLGFERKILSFFPFLFIFFGVLSLNLLPLPFASPFRPPPRPLVIVASEDSVSSRGVWRERSTKTDVFFFFFCNFTRH